MVIRKKLDGTLPGNHPLPIQSVNLNRGASLQESLPSCRVSEQMTGRPKIELDED